MGILESMIIVTIATSAFFSVLIILFKKRKKVEKSTEVNEKKVEPVYKSTKEDSKNPEEKTVTPPGKEKVTEQKNEPFKIIRKQSKVKINKKALTSGSRNPSVTKVFGKDVPDQGEKKHNTSENIDVDKNNIEDSDQIKIEKSAQKPVERFGVKEYEYSEVNTPDDFKINVPDGSPNRSFELKKREFGSHLTVSEDGNLSGVVGIGIKNAVISAESKLREIEKQNDQMLKRAHGSFGVISSDDDDDLSFFEQRLRQMSEDMNTKPARKKPNEVLKNIDIKTLIVAEAIANPKYKDVKSDDGIQE